LSIFLSLVCIFSRATMERRPGHRLRETYKAISLSTVHHTVQDVQYLQPEVQHPIPFGEDNEIMEEDLANQHCCLHPSLTHAHWVGLIDLWLQQSQN
jgi:hypothetical protein